MRQKQITKHTIDPVGIGVIGIGVIGIGAVSLFGPAQIQFQSDGLTDCEDARPRLAARQPR
jgi:hypothetical protein